MHVIGEASMWDPGSRAHAPPYHHTYSLSPCIMSVYIFLNNVQSILCTINFLCCYLLFDRDCAFEIYIVHMLTCVVENLQTAPVEHNILSPLNSPITPSPIDGESNFFWFEFMQIFFCKSSMQVADSRPHDSYQT